MATPTSKRTSGWTVGRLAGVDLRVHPTFLLLVALAASGLLGPPGDALAWLGIVFASVVIHELGHALVARRLGLTVRDIVLLPIGGASEIDDVGVDPRRELRISVAGPLTSFLVAACLAALLFVAGVDLTGPSLATGSLAMRAVWGNLMLGTFNLLPAIPMDGGRVLRSVLALRVGEAEATRRAAAISRWLAMAMAVVGVLLNVFLLLIAAFVWFAARAEETTAIVHTRLGGLLVRDAMTPLHVGDTPLGTVTVRETDSLEDALQALVATRDGLATVVDEGGVVTGVLLVRRVTDLLGPGDRRAA